MSDFLCLLPNKKTRTRRSGTVATVPVSGPVPFLRHPENRNEIPQNFALKQSARGKKKKFTSLYLVQLGPFLNIIIAPKRSQKFGVMKFENSERETCGGFFGGNISCQFLLRKIGLKFVTETSPHSSHRSSREAKEICHLVLTRSLRNDNKISRQ